MQEPTSNTLNTVVAEEIGDRIARLSPAKRALLEVRLERKSPNALDEPTIPRRARDAVCPLSFSQQRLWFLYQFDPESTVYNIIRALCLRGALNVAALQKALDAIVARHEILRTKIVSVDGTPVQVFAERAFVEFPLIDLSEKAELDRQNEVQHFLKSEGRRPFNLTSDVLLRATLLRLGKEEHLLVLTTHHIASDGWSAGILSRELATLYRAFSVGNSSPLPELPIQYADFALWQRQSLQAERLQSQLSYWKERLAGAPALLELPTDRPRPTVQSFRGSRRAVSLTNELTDALKAISKREGVTLFMTLLAAFKTLLSRYTSQHDILIGVPAANRTLPETEKLIGFFVNNLVLRTDLSGNPTFQELLRRVREVSLGAYAHQDLPFEKLVEELQPERSLSHTPLFQVMFGFQNTRPQPIDLPGLTVNSIAVESGTSKFDLFLSMVEETDFLRGWLEYNTDLFDDATIVRMLAHFETLLRGVVADPKRRLSDLSMLSEREREQLLVVWNATGAEYPRCCVQELFEAQAERTPDAVAVVDEGERLTYRELEERAERLASRLRAMGVRPNVLVGICLERSVDLAVGLLGILKAGGAYVPIDPAYPAERIEFMIEDSAMSVLLTQERVRGNLPQSGCRVVSLKQLASEGEFLANEVTHESAGAENLAYVIYTSGSTGRPKGVEIQHRALVNFLHSMRQKPGLTSQDVLLSVTTMSFDIAGLELFLPLIVGACVVIVSREVALDGRRLIEQLEKSGATVMQATPATWRMLIEAGWSGRKDLKILCGGEALPKELAKQLLEQSESLWNLYGPTESTIWSTLYRVEAVNGTVPIGRPIANTAIYILDRHMQPVPIGVPGELHIGGAGLARGYLNGPELTAEKFLTDPFSNVPQARLYKTGDLARYRGDGNIEYLGRLDHQVKLRGFRIELGEIESVLSQYAGVRETVVAVREDELGDKRLVAYLVVTTDSIPSVSDLRNFMKSKLPDSMVPSAFVELDVLPLTPNGKVDRKALPAPDHDRSQSEKEYVAPRTPVEEVVAEIWADVLKLNQVGLHDNFFDRGGHSLLATQVISRIRASLGVDLPLRRLFEAPTVAGQAESIETMLRAAPVPQAQPLVPVSRDGNLPLSFAQRRLWLLDQLEPGSSAYHIPGCFQLAGPLDLTALEQSLNEIIRRHEGLRTTFEVVDGQVHQVVAPTLGLTLSAIDLEGWGETERREEVRRLAQEEFERSFELNRGPLLRVRLIRTAGEEHILILVLHHIVADGWSMGVFFRELATLYEAFANGNPLPLPKLPIQYADYAIWQRQWLQGETLEKQLGYWKEKLANLSVLELPSDHPRPARPSHQGAGQSMVLSKGLTEALRGLSRTEGVTLFMTLLAAFKILLQRYSGQDDISVGSPIANRNPAEIEPLIGLFLNTLVLRTDLSNNPSFRELLARVREVSLGAYTHQDLPFEKLVEELHPERNLSRHPLFDVLFNFDEPLSSSFDLNGLTISRQNLIEPLAKFAMTLYAREEQGRLHLRLVYQKALFSAERMRCFLEQFQYLLEQVVGHPEKPIGDYSLVTGKSRSVLADPAVIVPEPEQELVSGLFSFWAEKTPQQAAVSQGDSTWSYGELAQRAESIARILRVGGLKKGEVVAVHGIRSFGLIGSVLGVLLSGGVLLLVDPHLPDRRKQLMLRQAGAKMLLKIGTEEAEENWLKGETDLSILSLGAADGRLADEKYLDLQRVSIPELSAEDAAYVFFTSGTTGVPKGILGCHKGLSHFIQWQRENFAIGPEDRVAQLTNLSFDPVLRDIFCPLSSGATLCLPQETESFGGDDTPAWLERERITVLHTVPTLAQSWLADGGAEVSLKSLRWVFFAGEPLTDRLVSRWRATFPQGGAEIVNLYGPTETTLAKCYYRVPAHVLPGVQPVGCPLPQTQALVLRENGQLCGIGEAGEIVLRTPFRTLGYINAAQENQRRFVKNPFRDDEQDLLYYTGDRGRYRPYGVLEILGRVDDQVKVRGVRVEPGEVTAILSQHPALKECVVVASKDEQDQAYLAAYVVASSDCRVTASELRVFLSERLAATMVPSAFVFLSRLPLTLNGKLDRRALPAPEQNNLERDGIFVAPRNPTEETLAEIWQEILSIERVGVYDNFFDLGGHSLLATRVISRVHNAFQVVCPLRNIFETPTIAGLAERIETLLWAAKQFRAAPSITTATDHVQIEL